jgi:hypothetical protein
VTDDVLSSLVSAYRAEHSARSLDRRSLRLRVVAAAGRRRVLRTKRLRWLWSVAATFAGSVALAASPPVREHVRDAFSFVRSGVSGRAERATSSPPKGGTRRAVSLPAPLHPVAPEPSGTPAPAPAPAEVLSVAQLPMQTSKVAATPLRAVPERAADESAPSSSRFLVESSTPAVPPVGGGLPSADLALYRRAHELHFGGADRALALGAWNAYLKAFPRGAFAPEARLNRAVCLAKLGHEAEAERVLVDIERGRFGTDGRRQARKILGVLKDD